MTNIKRKIKQRMFEWEEKSGILHSSTVICAEVYLNHKRKSLNTKERVKALYSLIWGGEVRTAIRYVSERETGEIMLPGNVDGKTGDIVKETLELKHLEGRNALVETLPDFESCHELINIVVRDNTWRW